MGAPADHRARAGAARANRAGGGAGTPNDVVARQVRVTRQTVGRWRARFVAQRLDGLLDEPRPGAPRTITDADVGSGALRRTLETHADGRDALEHALDGEGRAA